jgi:autoinducer 2-binding periplasmic protein LuxP
MQRRFFPLTSLTVLILLALVLAACPAPAPVAQPGAPAAEAPTPADVAEQPAAEDEEEDGEIWTMFQVWERDPAEREKLMALREIASAPGTPANVTLDQPLRIAFVWPSFDLSEGWARGAIAFRERLEEFEIPIQVTEFGSEIDNHTMQASHIETILAGDYDYVLIGPTELDVQRTLIQDMIQRPDLHVIVWNYSTPIREWDALGQPLSYVGFDHAEGGQLLCDWIVEETGGQGDFATMRFVPGFLDNQRVGTFSDCAEAAGMVKVYDHFADGTRERAYEGTNAALAAYPDLVHIHASNTATAMGTLSALREQDRAGELILNGWGGGQEELDAMLEGHIHVTPMRMQDDFGVFPAEIIKMHLEGRTDEIPLVAAGEIVLVNFRWTAEEIEAQKDYAFRYSGVLER